MLNACGSGDAGERTVERELPSEASDIVGLGDPDEPPSTVDRETLVQRDYDVGDCVMWDLEETQGSPSAPLRTDVVPCTEPHRIQIAERAPVPESETYPTLTEWDIHGQAVCAARAQLVLGVPHDPYGRFTVDWLFPLEEGWLQGDRTMWCGVGGRGETADPASLLREDARGADQWYRYQPGQCVAEPPLVQAPAVVPCDQPHQLEITGRVDYADGGPLPPVNEADVRCQDTVIAYLGGLPPQPWAVGSDPLLPESWAAGRRFSGCFLG